MAFFSIAGLRTILTTETDADSPGSQELLDQIRENLEALLLLGFADGFTGTVTVIAEVTLTHAGAAQTVDEHNGRTLLITSGGAIGNMYTIDDTTAQTLVCTGDTLVTDGVAVGDTFAVLYDVKNNLDGHDHNGVNSKELGIALKAGGLNTATGTTSGTIGIDAEVNITMQDYCFFPRIEVSDMLVVVSGNLTPETSVYVGKFGLHNTDGIGQHNYEVDWRYMTATDEPFIYALVRKSTGDIEGVWMCDDPPPGYWGSNEPPEDFVPPIQLLTEQIADFDEIILFKCKQKLLGDIRKESKKQGKKAHKTLNDHFEYDPIKKTFNKKLEA